MVREGQGDLNWKIGRPAGDPLGSKGRKRGRISNLFGHPSAESRQRGKLITAVLVRRISRHASDSKLMTD